MSEVNTMTLPDLSVQALASQYHRYIIWNNRAGTPNYHGSIKIFYGAMLDQSDLERVAQFFNETYRKSQA